MQLIRLPSITSNGRTGRQMIGELEGTNHRMGPYTKERLGGPMFVTTNGTIYKPVVMVIGANGDRVNQKIRVVAEQGHLLTPPEELAPLLRPIVSDNDIREMGLERLIVMHEPVVAQDKPRLLGLSCHNIGQWLGMYLGKPDIMWARGFGFVFLAPN